MVESRLLPDSEALEKERIAILAEKYCSPEEYEKTKNLDFTYLFLETEKSDSLAEEAAKSLVKTVNYLLNQDTENLFEEQKPKPIQPDELQRAYGPTLEAIEKGYSTPEHIARYTGRDEKLESSYLWRLRKAGLIKLDEKGGYNRLI